MLAVGWGVRGIPGHCLLFFSKSTALDYIYSPFKYKDTINCAPFSIPQTIKFPDRNRVLVHLRNVFLSFTLVYGNTGGVQLLIS